MVDEVHALRRWRKENGISLAKLAEKVESTKSWLSRIEGGEQASAELISKLKAETGLSADHFIRAAEPAQ